MEPHFEPPPLEPTRPPLPSLPIVTPDPPRMNTAEKYGALYYLAIAGLVVLVGLVGYFARGLWSLRGVMANIYTLHSTQRTDAERIQAAYALSRDPRVTQHEYWDICLRKPLPPLARYLMAEAVTADSVAPDPRAYALTVARSADWPDWLRLQLARPLAYAAAQGMAIPHQPLVELEQLPDPSLSLWSEFALAASEPVDAGAAARIEHTAQTGGPYRELAGDLLAALRSRGQERRAWLDKATLWLRRNHASSSQLWDGWREDGGRLVQVPISAPNLQPNR